MHPHSNFFDHFCSLGLFRAMSFAVAGLSIGEKYLSEFLDGFLFRTKRLSFYLNPSKFRDLYLLYTRLMLIIQKVDNFVTPAATGLLSGTFCLLILSNLVTIRLSSVVPMPFFMVFPTLSLVVPITNCLMIPQAVRVFEDGSLILKEWKVMLPLLGPGVARAYRVKRLRALKPCRLHAGLGIVKFFYFKRSTFLSYCGLSLYYTVNVLLSVSL
jgi:hypothetical protein